MLVLNEKTFTDSVVLHAVLNTKEAGDIKTPKGAATRAAIEWCDN